MVINIGRVGKIVFCLFFLMGAQSFASTKIIIKYKEGVSLQKRNKLLLNFSVNKERPFVYLTQFQVVQALHKAQLPVLLNYFNSHPDIEYAEQVVEMKTDSVLTPSDPLFERQWNLRNVGQTLGTSGADINIMEAWALETGRFDVVVAVLDSGIDYHHDDLKVNIWNNVGEIAGNGLDDDGNGFIDDTRGWDFVNNDNDPMDDRGHGTHVAGVIGAVGNNGLGMAGIAWRIQLMPVKVLGQNGSGGSDIILRGLEYAIVNGAHIINNSYGTNIFSKAIEDAIKIAYERNILFVASAGNKKENNDLIEHYPSNYKIPNVISVAASDERDRLAYFSNFGAQTVHLVAPGSVILSCKPGNKYELDSGTSLASPHVSGVAALLLSKHIDLSVLDIKRLILENVEHKNLLQGKVQTAGRLNAVKALRSLF